MRIKVYPKINLCLKVYKNTSESKHPIDSIFALYKKIHDTIRITKCPETFILYKEKGKHISISDCLVSKALSYLHSKYKFDTNYKIEINKRIPFGAGLGGGSADAAAVINYVLKRNKPVTLDLKEIALELGSDIPFFLSRLPLARVREFGNFVSPIYDWKPSFVVDLNTNINCDTEQVFASLSKDRDYISKVNVDRIIEQRLYKQHSINVVYNDLTKYIIQNYKELQDIYKKYGSSSFFSGAGSTIVTLKE